MRYVIVRRWTLVLGAVILAGAAAFAALANL
jgi:hypothetical protein